MIDGAIEFNIVQKASAHIGDDGVITLES